MAKDTMSFLAEFFGERICKWPPCCPDLSLLDFFLQSYLKNIVSKDAPQSIADRKKKIKDAVRETDTTMCWMVLANLLKRNSSCLANEGGYSEHLQSFKRLSFFFSFFC